MMEGMMLNTEDRHLPDHESDPARTPGDGWVGEGGASHLGPATHTESGHPRHEADEDSGGEEGIEGSDEEE